jgi:DNA-binding MarR family transcriptional regulator
MNSFKKDLMEAVALVSNIENKLKISSLNGNEKIVFYSILIKERNDDNFIISDVIRISKLSRSTVFKTIKKLESLSLVSLIQSTEDKREFSIKVNI